MWDDLMISFMTTLEKAEDTYMTKAKSMHGYSESLGRNLNRSSLHAGFNCTDEENSTSLATLRRRAWRNFRAKIDEQLSDVAILAKLRAHFEEKFRYDAAGVPKVWKPEDDIDGAFKMAKQDVSAMSINVDSKRADILRHGQTLDLIPLYASIKTTNPAASFDLPPETSSDTSLDADADVDFDASLIIFSETKKLDLENRFRRDADAYYVEAKRSMVSSIAQIPMWMYGALVVLGWNEAMTVLFNPLYAAMLLVLGATA
jgi:protein SEY1